MFKFLKIIKNFVKNFKIRNKLLFLSAIVLVGFVLSTVMGIYMLNEVKVGSKLYAKIKADKDSLEKIALLGSDLNHYRAEMALLIDETNKDKMEQIKALLMKLKAEIENNFFDILNLSNSEEKKISIRDAQSTWSDFQTTVEDTLIPAVHKGKRLQARELVRGIQEMRYESYINQIKTTVNLLKLEIEELEKFTDMVVKKKLVFSTAISGILFLIILGFTLMIGISIFGPVKKMDNFVRNVASGELTATVEIDSMDEIGKMGGALMEMSEYLQVMAKNAEAISEGDLRADIMPKSEKDILGNAFKKMVDYLQGMAKTAEEIAEGRLGIDVTPKSEKDVLGNAFKKMVTGLKGMIIEIKSGAENLSGTSTLISSSVDQTSKSSELSASAVEEITATMHEMSATVQSVSRNIQSQSASVTETSSSIEQMVSSIQMVANHVKQLVDITHKSLDAVMIGKQAVMKASSGMEEINSVTIKAADAIGRLGSKSDDIVRIIEVIDDIAEQTNLLALNAAIEAARAGEQGMGFAVVAEEVRKLAERSAKSTREIAVLINIVTKESQEAVSHMDNNADIVEQGLVLSREVNQALQKIEEAVAEVSKYSQEIGIATVEQSSGSEQIQKAMVSLNDITQEISTSAEEQSSGAEQVVKAIERVREMVQQNALSSVNLLSVAEQLKKQADSLQTIVTKFSLNGRYN